MTTPQPLPKRERDKLARMADAFDKIDRLLMRLGMQGLQRMTQSSAEELQAMEQTAHNAALITIERQIQTLRTHVQRYIDKDPLFSMGLYTATINRIWLLTRAARARHASGAAPAEMIDLNGETRRTYNHWGKPLVLQPIGASGWITDTDFVGITVYFFAEGFDGILQATTTRPKSFFDYMGQVPDPRSLLYMGISDHIPFNIHDMTHGAFEFRSAKISSDNRLSLHKDLKVSKAPYIGARAYEALSCPNWVALAERLKEGEVHPVSGAGSSFAFIAPSEFGDLYLDEKGSRALAEVYDAHGARLIMEVPLRKENNFLIDNLELLLGPPVNARGGKKKARPLTKLRPDALFGRAWIAGGHLKFFPFTAIYNQAVVYASRTKQRVNEIHLSLESIKDVSLGDPDKGGGSEGKGVRRRKKAMNQDIHNLLDAALDESSKEAEALRQRFVSAPPNASDLADIAENYRLVDRFLSDIDEALKQVFVAGLAYPDPELPDELALLADRALRHGLPTAVEHLRKLALLVETILAERDLAWRQEFAARAWSETQRFVAWVRLFSAEHQHLTVQGILASQSTGQPEQRRATYPERSMSVWPIGIELGADGRLVIYGRGLDPDVVVLLRDQLAEFDPDAPLQSRSISRLFQDSVRLCDVLGQVIRLESHPVVTRSRALLFRPAFQSTPRLLPVADGFIPPSLPNVPLDDEGEPRPVISDGPARIGLKIRLDGGRLSARTLGAGTAELDVSEAVLRFNLTKLLARGGAASDYLDFVVLPRRGALKVLNLTTASDGVTYPAHDPTLFEIADTVLARRAEAAAKATADTPLATSMLLTAAYLLGGGERHKVVTHTDGLLELPMRSLDDHYTAGLCRFLCGEPFAPEGMEALLRDTLQIAAGKGEDPVNLDRLAQILGREPGNVSPSDRRLLDGDAVYKAIWLAILSESPSVLAEPLRALFIARYQGELRSTSPGDVCARTLMLAILHAPGGADAEEESTPLSFLTAFTQDLPDAGKQGKPPLPDLMALFWYADTLAMLTGGDRHGAPMTQLDISRDTLAQTCADHLFGWLSRAEVTDPAILKRAAIALLTISAAGLRPLLVC